MGLSEIILILFVVLLLFGADKLPEMARTLGKTIRQIRDATNEIKTEIEQSTHQSTDIDTKFIADTQKEIDKLKNDLTK